MTQEELKRLAKMPTDEELGRLAELTDLVYLDVDTGDYGTVYAGDYIYEGEPGYCFGDEYDGIIFASIVSSLLAPWTAVPVREGDNSDEWMLVQLDPTVRFYNANTEEATIYFLHATRFASPLAAAEALHQNTEKV